MISYTLDTIVSILNKTIPYTYLLFTRDIIIKINLLVY